MSVQEGTIAPEFELPASGGRTVSNKALRGKPRQHDARRRHVQFGRRAPVDQPQHLRDELHLDLPAGAQLHVPRAIRRQLAQDAPAHRCGVGADATGIPGLRQRLDDRGLDAGAQRRRTSHHAGARQRHALPGPGGFGVVAAE